MQHIIFRKKIDKLIILYIFLFLIAFPILMMNVINTIQYHKTLDITETFLQQKHFPAAHKQILQTFEKYGYHKRTMHQYLRYLIQNTQAHQDFLHVQEIIRVGNYLIHHFLFTPKEVYRDLSYGYYALGKDYYPIAESSLNAYIQKTISHKVESQAYHTLYMLYFKQEKSLLTKETAEVMCSTYPENQDFKVKLASAHLLNGQVLKAQSLLEELLYQNEYSVITETAAEILIEILEAKLNLPQKSQHIRSYMEYKRRQYDTHVHHGQRSLVPEPITS